MPRRPFQIAFDIRHEMNAYLLFDKRKGRRVPVWISTAKPYIQAMLQLQSITDRYYFDSGYEICLRALCNLRSWRGERAKALKTEIQALLDSCPKEKHL